MGRFHQEENPDGTLFSKEAGEAGAEAIADSDQHGLSQNGMIRALELGDLTQSRISGQTITYDIQWPGDSGTD